jgi:RNA polymerase sigma factor (sigma-70 family)
LVISKSYIYATFASLTGPIYCVDTNLSHTYVDKNLVASILDGNTRAFGDIIRNTEKLVAQIVFKMVSHAEDRRDLAQEIYLKAFKSLPHFRFESKLSTWIARIAYNTCLSHLEKKKLVLAGVEADPERHGGEDPEGPASKAAGAMGTETEKRLFQKELSGILREEINELPPVYRTLITLFHQEEMSYEEIYVITGLPEGTVKSYLFRARKTLKVNLLAKYKKEAL